MGYHLTYISTGFCKTISSSSLSVHHGRISKNVSMLENMLNCILSPLHIFLSLHIILLFLRHSKQDQKAILKAKYLALLLKISLLLYKKYDTKIRGTVGKNIPYFSEKNANFHSQLCWGSANDWLHMFQQLEPY